MATTTRTLGLHDVLTRGDVRAVFQPVVRLADCRVVGVEALARGPAGTDLERPDRLFAAARAAGRVAELDRLCTATAIETATAQGLGPGTWLSINVEPDGLLAPPPAWFLHDLDRAADRLDVVVEITERMLTAHPAGLLQLVDRVRDWGWRIALDDVGAHPSSLALMPLIRPDVIKLDLRIVQQRPDLAIAQLVSALQAEAGRTGATLLAEGIETEQHLEIAESMGATLGQGWLFGRPGDLDEIRRAPEPPRPRTAASPRPHLPDTPAGVAANRAPRRMARKDLLIQISKHLEAEALALGERAIVLAAFQHVDHFTTDTRERYRCLARSAGMTAALGVGMPTRPVEGVHGGALDADDPLREEWDLAVLGPHFAAALVAHDRGDTGPQVARRFDYVLTYDRRLVQDVASALVRRVSPRSPA